MQHLHPGLEAKAIFSELGSDWLFRCPTIQIAAQHAGLRAQGADPGSSSTAGSGPGQQEHSESSGPIQQAEGGLQAAGDRAAGSRAMALSQTHCFEFAAANPDRPGQPVFHSAELPYTFGTLDVKHQGKFRLAPERSTPVEGLSERMQNAWASFCRCGDPEWGCAGWESSSPVQRVWSLPDQQGQHQRPPLDSQHAVWDGFIQDALDIPKVTAGLA